MLSKSKAVFGLLKRVRNFDCDDFVDRFYAQKIGYILQYGFDLNLGYRFDCDVKGPYSLGLTEDLYKIKNTEKLEKTIFRSRKEEKIFKKALEFFEETEPDVNQIRLFASMIHANRDSGLKKGETVNKLRKRPAFYESDLQGTWDLLKKYNLVAE